MDQGNNEFLQTLAELGRWIPSKIKVLFTSRPMAVIEEPLKKSKMLQIRLVESMVDRDITAFVEHGLSSSTIAQDDQDLIRRAIPGHANGHFLYAKLAMNAFLEPGARINKILRAPQLI